MERERELSQRERLDFASAWTRSVYQTGVCPSCGAALKEDAMFGWYRCSTHPACFFLMYVGTVREPLRASSV